MGGDLLIILGIGYFLPWIIAACRSHSNAKSILVMNLFLGWTGIGWVWCLIWSFSDNTKSGKSRAGEKV